MRFVLSQVLLVAISFQLVSAGCAANGCRCSPATSPGIYCGWCSAVTQVGYGGSYSDAFQCRGRICCNYGPRKSCQDSSHYSPCG
ncbi:hypothetical protein BJX68DRAFT_235059 [Aspergillus pseudodeflectus]|uniref:Uncharacterized protein n=1 Tax=Aspergillus pseudodeflectus TaxID=176178 RepID=A0ABR4KLS8_9EURO